MTAADVAAQAVIAAGRRFGYAVTDYQRGRVDLIAVRTARAEVAAAWRALLALGEVGDIDVHAEATRANTTTARTTRRLIDAHQAGTPCRGGGA